MRRSIREANAKDLRELRRMSAVSGFLIDFGIARAAIARSPYTGKLPADLRDELTYLQLQPKYLKAMLSEESSFEESADEVRGAGTLGDKPVIVLTAGAAEPIPDVPNEDASQFFAIWVGELQPRLARLSTRGRQIVLMNSHHLIPFEEPEAVVNAVTDVMVEVKQRTK